MCPFRRPGGQIGAARLSKQPVRSQWYPTVAAMATDGSPSPSRRWSDLAGTGPVAVDGQNMWPSIKTGEESPRRSMVLNMDGQDEHGAGGVPAR